MSFLSAPFLMALAAAAGPLLIHLINRRRHRTLEWAAMDFLREAIQRNRRLVELRDMVLLALRTLAVVFFVLALAQPRWSSEQRGANATGEPVHAVLVMDNSLSMGYTQLDKTLLDVARERAGAFVRTLPRGSHVSVLPLCSADSHAVRDVYATREDALEALANVRLADRSGYAGEGVERARSALASSPLPTKRVVFLGDMQAQAWSGPELKRTLEELGDVQLVQVSPQRRTNTWVSSFRLRDGVADTESPAVFEAVLRHDGDERRSQLRVTLKVNAAVAEERFVDLQPGQSLHLHFKHRFDVAGSSREPLFVSARLELAPDGLPHDDFRELVVPVIAQVPVLFVDEMGDLENPKLNRFGETYPLRRLLAPRKGDREGRHLLEVRHRRPDQVALDDLREARLVVVAGVRSLSAEAVGLLRQYVVQGGQLLLAAGGGFDPVLWNAGAWRDGAGILPVRLKDTMIGRLPPPQATSWPSFHLAPASFREEVASLPLSDADRAELLSLPFFYQAVGVDLASGEEAVKGEAVRLAEEASRLAAQDVDEKRWAEAERRGPLEAGEAARREAARREVESLRPTWLAWRQALSVREESGGAPAERAARRTLPRVLGSYDNAEPFAVSRRIGQGQVVLLTTGVFPVWNNLAAEHSVVLLDALARGMLADSLPDRTLEPVNDVVVPIEARDQGTAFLLKTPGEEPKPVAVEALGQSEFGVIIRSLDQRGTYRLSRQAPPGGGESAEAPWSVSLAVNGPASESELASVTRQELMDRLEAPRVRWVDLDQEITLDGQTTLGFGVWKWLMLLALACLLAEMAAVARPGARQEAHPEARADARQDAGNESRNPGRENAGAGVTA